MEHISYADLRIFLYGKISFNMYYITTTLQHKQAHAVFCLRMNCSNDVITRF